MPIPLPELPTGNTTICLVIPDSPEWRQIYMGSLLILQKWWYYDTNNSEDVEDIVQRVMDCHYLTTQNYEGCTMTDCEDVADCIETSESVANALNIVLSQYQGIGTGNASGMTDATKNIVLADGTICNPDNIFAFATQCIDMTNQAVVDFYELIESSTFFYEQLQTVLEWIPILDQLGVDNVVGLIENFISQMGTAYAAAYDSTLRDELRCDLFCMIIENDCVFNWDMLAQYFADKAVYSIINLDLEDLVEYFAEGIFSGTEWVYSSMWLFWGMISLLSKFGTQATTTLVKVLQSMFNDEDPDWSIICEDCPVTWSWDSDFPTSENIWIPRASLGINESIWVDGQGFNSVDINPSGAYWRVDAIQASFDPTVVNNISMIYNLTKGTYDNPTNVAVGIFAYSGGSGGTLAASETLTLTESDNGTALDMSLTVEAEIDYIFVFVRSSNRATNSYSGACKIVSVHADGDDINPFT